MTSGIGHGLDIIIVGGVIATGTVLARAGASHAWNPSSLARTLSTGSPHRWLAAGVRFWGLVEVALGAGLLLALLRPGSSAAVWAIATSSVL